MALAADSILAVLDASAATLWPDFWGLTMTEYHALRLVAVRSRSGDRWGVVFDILRGTAIDDSLALGAGVWRQLNGPEVTPGQLPVRHLPLVLPEDRDFNSADLAGLTIEGPAGTLVCDAETIARLDLRLGRVCNNDGSSGGPLDMLAIRAYLTQFPGSLWPPAEESAALLGIEDGEIVVVSDAFHHVLGPLVPLGRDDLTPLAILPSASPTYRSLAEAIAARDPSRFQPGPSNLDWRNWAIHTDDSVDPSLVYAGENRA